MRLTTEQREAIKNNGNTLVVACPGSGKTRTLIAKLLRCIDDVRDSPRRIGCITYTNTAVYEIEHRLRVYGATGDDDYCEVCTIHAFCQNNILRHFAWKLSELRDGYSILPPDSDKYLEYVNEIGDKYDLSPFDRSRFEQLGRTPGGQPIVSGDFPPDAAVDFWARLEQDGYLDFCNIVYFSYRILRDNPSIARGLASRFAHILVDEFQDTSALQVEILSIIASHNVTQFFLVGDPEQSIYSFAGAEPTLMYIFSERIAAHVSPPLLGNWRSSTPIVECAEKIRRRSPPMYAAGLAADSIEQPIHVESQDYFEAITDEFLPMVDQAKIKYGECAILSPQWPFLRPVASKLREYGIPVVGPGARPYKRSLLFARLAEQMCAHINKPKPEFAKQAEKELYNLILTVTGRANFSVFSFAGRRVIYRLFEIGRQVLDSNESAVRWLRKSSELIGIELHQEGLLPATGIELLKQSVEEMISDMRHNDVDIGQLTTDELALFADPEECMKLMTIHTSKGREFDAVAIIGVHERYMPWYNSHNPLTNSGIEEGRRLFYVAATRAKRVLMFITDRNNERPKSRYLSEIGL